MLKSKSPKSYKNKKLNDANFSDFSHTDYLVFLYLTSKLGGVDEEGKYLQPEKLQREHVLTAKEYSQLFEVNIDNSYKIIRKACKKLMKTSVTLEKIDLNEIWEVNVCSAAKYNETKGSITVEFTDRILPYLSQVRKRFVLYNLKEITNFRSLYTTRLYELLQEFKETGYMVKSIEQLRTIFAVGAKLQRYSHFKQKTFSHAVQEINDNYKMGLTYEEIKEGRKVVAISFKFKKTIVFERVNQKTGIAKKYYKKPEQIKNSKRKTSIKNSESYKNLPEEQFDFKNKLQNKKKVGNFANGIIQKLANKFNNW